MVEMTEAEYRKLRRAAGRQQNGGLFWAVFGLVLIGLLVILFLDHFGKLPPELVERIAGKPQVLFSTPVPEQPVVLPPAVIRENPIPPLPTPGPIREQQPAVIAAPQEQPTSIPTATPNLAPALPDANPGFTCGVEPGMDPNADCEDTRPDAGDVQSASIPKAAPRRVGERASSKVGPGGSDE